MHQRSTLMNSQISPITVTAFRWVPPPVRGLVRDLRVRWALEEAGLPYSVKLLGPKDQVSAEYREWQPFGQVPAYEQDGLALFESGAIVLHSAGHSAVPESGHSSASTDGDAEWST
jgi:glutathione S-transferase